MICYFQSTWTKTCTLYIYYKFSLSYFENKTSFQCMQKCLDTSLVRSEPPHDKTNKMACAPSEDSDQPGHPPGLIRVFTVRKKKDWVLSYPLSTQRRIWSNWAHAQAVSLCWVPSHIVGFVMRQLKWVWSRENLSLETCNLERLEPAYSVTEHCKSLVEFRI